MYRWLKSLVNDKSGYFIDLDFWLYISNNILNKDSIDK